MDRGWSLLAEQLQTVTVDAGPALSDLRVDMCRALRTEKMISYGLEMTGGGVQGLAFCHTTEETTDALRDHFARYVRETPNFGVYNPLRPQLRQRNRVLPWRREDIDTTVPIIRDLYPSLGIAGRAQARVLVCQGDTMMAFVGAWQPDAFVDAQLRTFRTLTVLLRKRLEIEAAHADGRRHAGRPQALLDAALEAIGRPVLVLGNDGRVREANRLAQAIRPDREPLETQLRHVHSGHTPRGWDVTRVERRGGGYDLLVLLPLSEVRTPPTPVAALGRAWQLTARQSDVLALLCEGRSNPSIAAILAISIRTVEVHVAALFDKARVSTRSALVAKALSLS